MKYKFETDDREEASRAMNADKLYSSIFDFLQELRSVWKHSDNEEDAEQAEKWRDKLNNILHENGVNMEDYC